MYRDLPRGIPWSPPARGTSIYLATDGPEQEVMFKLGGELVFLVRPTAVSAINSGRGTFFAQCMTCEQVLHDCTTGPRHYVEAHDRKGCTNLL